MATRSSILAWKNPMDRGAWWATVHRVTKNWTWPKQFSTHACIADLQCYVSHGLPRWFILPGQAIQVWSLNQEDPLEEEMTTHSSFLAWEIPWAEEPGKLQSAGSQRVLDTTKQRHTHIMLVSGAQHSDSLFLWIIHNTKLYSCWLYFLCNASHPFFLNSYFLTEVELNLKQILY